MNGMSFSPFLKEKALKNLPYQNNGVYLHGKE